MALTYRGTELRSLPTRYFWIVDGWRDGIEVRGSDFLIAGAPGMYELNRIAKWRVIHLSGLVLTDDQAAWDTEMATLEALFDPVLGSGDLVVASPYMGLAAGSRTIAARVENYITLDIQPQLKTRLDVTLHAVGNPPDWA